MLDWRLTLYLKDEPVALFNLHQYKGVTLCTEMFSFLIQAHGEQFSTNAPLCPIPDKYIENHGEQILLTCHLCPNPEDPWGTFPLKYLPVPKPHAGVLGTTTNKTMHPYRVK